VRETVVDLTFGKFEFGEHLGYYKYAILELFQEIQPTLQELGISSVEEMGYDKPELALKSVFDVHG